MPDILGFEETPLMLKPYESQGAKGDPLIALSPNNSKESLKNVKKADLFYFHPTSGFTVDCFETGKLKHVLGPRDYDKFAEGVDSLCPVVYLKEIIYVPLKTSDNHLIGVLQLINKSSGFSSEADITLATLLGTVLANSILMVMRANKLSGTMDHIISSVVNATKDVVASHLSASP